MLKKKLNIRQLSNMPLNELVEILPERRPLEKEDIYILSERIHKKRVEARRLLEQFKKHQLETLAILKAIQANREGINQ